MSFYFRRRLANMLLESLGIRLTAPTTGDACYAERLARLIVPRFAARSFDTTTPQFVVNTKHLDSILDLDKGQALDRIRRNHAEAGELIFEKNYVLWKTDPRQFMESIIKDVRNCPQPYGHGYELHQYISSKNGLVHRPKREKIVVEFGSPNVAKPLHAGHLRSIIIGQFVANINRVVGNTVVRMNYLGDWGTQFGLLAVGFYKYGNEEALAADALNHLLDVYVKVVEQCEAEGLTVGPTHKLALNFMHRLENGDREALAVWRRFRDLSVPASQDIFRRLGIQYDEVEHESDYVEESQALCQELENQGLLKYDDNNVGYIINHLANDETMKKIILKKSDGTSLYLTRDLAAILNRLKTYDFDKIHYVVDSGQIAHFEKLKRVLELMGNRTAWQEHLHINFGRVRRMSTRKGNAVHLNDVLDETKRRMMEIILDKSTTRTKDLDNVADNLALSAIFIQDLKEKRQKDYDFDWNRMLSNKGETGSFLQYGHARLCSLEETFPDFLQSESNVLLLNENEAIRLVQHLSRFDQILNECYNSLEPHTLVHYLFDLVTLSNGALAKLSIKNSPLDVACARMHLFHCTRLVLTNGIEILGLQPLRAI